MFGLDYILKLMGIFILLMAPEARWLTPLVQALVLEEIRTLMMMSAGQQEVQVLNSVIQDEAEQNSSKHSNIGLNASVLFQGIICL